MTAAGARTAEMIAEDILSGAFEPAKFKTAAA